MRLPACGACCGLRWLLAVAVLGLAWSEVVHVNFGYFQEAAAHLWTYGVDSHSWVDPVSGDEFRFTFWPQTSGGRVFEKLSVGDLDFAVLGSAPWGMSSTRSLPAKLVYNIKSVDQGEVFACRSDIVEPRDLRGKRVAYVPGSTVHYMMDALLSFTSLSWSDFEWVGGLNPGDQKAAWDAGEIDCGFVWMPVLAHIQTAPWCSSPDASPSSVWRSKLGVGPRPCAAGPTGVHGHSFFTGGMATMWGKGVWNGLVVSDAFAARYPRTVQRSLKVMTAMDSKFVEDRGFFTASETRLCMICTALGWPCDAAHYDRVKNDVALDSVQTWAEQRSPAFLGEQAPGQCALETIPPAAAAASTCTKLTASSSALSTYASAAFNFGLKNLPHLPTLKHYQDLVDSSYMDLMGGAADPFPELDAEALAWNYTAPLQGAADGAGSFCQESAAQFGDVTLRLVICTNGCFKQRAFVRLLLPTLAPLDLLAVVCEESFRFPTSATMEELRDGAADGDALVNVVAELFAGTCLSFAAPSQPEKTLQVQALCVARRLEAAGGGRGSTRGLPCWAAPAGTEEKPEPQTAAGAPPAVECCSGPMILIEI